MLKETHLKRFFEVIQKKRIWSLTELTKEINLLLPSNIELTERTLAILITNQQTYHVFKCLAKNKDNKSKKGMYYIFRRTLNGWIHKFKRSQEIS